MGHSGILFADWQKSRPIFFRVISSGSKTENVGRALEWHSRGQRFDPAYLHQQKGFKSLRFEAFFVFFPLLRSIFHAKSERNEFSVLPLLYMARISA